MVQPHGELWAPTVLFVIRVKAVISWALPARQVPSTTCLFTRLVFTATLSTLCYPISQLRKARHKRLKGALCSSPGFHGGLRISQKSGFRACVLTMIPPCLTKRDRATGCSGDQVRENSGPGPATTRGRGAGQRGRHGRQGPRRHSQRGTKASLGRQGWKDRRPPPPELLALGGLWQLERFGSSLVGG